MNNDLGIIKSTTGISFQCLGQNDNVSQCEDGISLIVLSVTNRKSMSAPVSEFSQKQFIMRLWYVTFPPRRQWDLRNKPSCASPPSPTYTVIMPVCGSERGTVLKKTLRTLVYTLTHHFPQQPEKINHTVHLAFKVSNHTLPFFKVFPSWCLLRCWSHWLQSSNKNINSGPPCTTSLRTTLSSIFFLLWALKD